MKINEHSFENLLSMERVEWQALRQQVGDQVVKALEGCEHITATGHSIGAALAAVLSAQKELAERRFVRSFSGSTAIEACNSHLEQRYRSLYSIIYYYIYIYYGN